MPPARLRASLDERFGPNLNVRMASVLALGAEDDAALLAREVAQAAPTDMVAALFALTATPERETHGAFVQALGGGARAGRRMPGARSTKPAFGGASATLGCRPPIQRRSAKPPGPTPASLAAHAGAAGA